MKRRKKKQENKEDKEEKDEEKKLKRKRNKKKQPPLWFFFVDSSLISSPFHLTYPIPCSFTAKPYPSSTSSLPPIATLYFLFLLRFYFCLALHFRMSKQKQHICFYYVTFPTRSFHSYPFSLDLSSSSHTYVFFVFLYFFPFRTVNIFIISLLTFHLLSFSFLLRSLVPIVCRLYLSKYFLVRFRIREQNSKIPP